MLTHQQASKYQSLLSLLSFSFPLSTALFCLYAISSSSILQDISLFPSLAIFESETFQSTLYTGHLLHPFSFKSEPFKSSFATSSYISILLSTTFHILIKNMHSCLSCYQTTHIFLLFTSSDNFIAYLLLQITLLRICTPFLLLFSFHSSNICHIIIHIHLFSVQSHHSHATNKHSNSFSIISCPNPFLPIITITFSSHNNSSKTVFFTLILFIAAFFNFFRTFDHLSAFSYSIWTFPHLQTKK